MRAPTDPSSITEKDGQTANRSPSGLFRLLKGFVMLKIVVLLAMAGVLALAANSNSIEGFGRDAGIDPDATPSG